ncbi:hypothetical protein BH11MYX4_BH11MYX4_07280 [soil metagenome]
MKPCLLAELRGRATAYGLIATACVGVSCGGADGSKSGGPADGGSTSTPGGGSSLTISEGLRIDIDVQWTANFPTPAADALFVGVLHPRDPASPQAVLVGQGSIGNGDTLVPAEGRSGLGDIGTGSTSLPHTGRIEVKYTAGSKTASGVVADPMPWITPVSIPAKSAHGQPVELTWRATAEAQCFVTAESWNSGKLADAGKMTIPASALATPGSYSIILSCEKTVTLEPGVSSITSRVRLLTLLSVT